MNARCITRAALLATLTVALSACTITRSAEPISEEDLVEEAEGAMSGADADSMEVSCDGGLEAEVDATQDCTVTDPNGGELHMRYTVTDVDGDELSFSKQPFIPRSDLDTAVVEQLGSQGVTATGASCPDDLIGEEGSDITCELEGSTLYTEATVTITDVTGSGMRYTVEAS